MDELTVLTWRLPRVNADGLEAVTLPEAERVEALREIRDAAGASEMAYVPTCQRVVVALLHAREPDAALAAYAKRVGKPIAEPERFRARAAFRHLGEVASSLDSLVPGEPQVLGQFKESVRQSDEAGLAGPGLRHVFGLVFRAAKAVRTETDLFRGKVSLLPLTEDLVEKHLAGKPQVRAAVLGTGHIGTRMAQLLREKRPDVELHLVSRSAARAREVGGRALADFEPQAFDIVACAMQAEAPLLDAQFLQALAAQRDVLVLDLAVPRNTQAPELLPPGLALVQIDDLERVSAARKAEREQEIGPARLVLERELDRIDAEYEERKLAHDLAQLAARFEEVARERLAQAPSAVDAKWHEQTVRALLHEATQAVRKAGCRK